MEWLLPSGSLLGTERVPNDYLEPRPRTEHWVVVGRDLRVAPMYHHGRIYSEFACVNIFGTDGFLKGWECCVSGQQHISAVSFQGRLARIISETKLVGGSGYEGSVQQ